MTRILTPDGIFDGDMVRNDVSLMVVDGKVHLCPRDDRGEPVSGIVSPGFVDVQVNGGGGVLFNTATTPEGIAAILAAHRRSGTVVALPTLISDTHNAMVDAAEAAIDAIGQPGFVGMHFEGPHFAQSRRGTHAARHIRPFDDVTLACCEKLRGAGLVVKLTLAPERVALETIRLLAGMGVIVSLGHSDATAIQARAAFAVGARSVTHLFNAMSPLTHREPGLAGAAMTSDAYVGIIADGIHVEDSVLGLACRSRPVSGRMVLVSDAMPTVNGPDCFDLYGAEIRVEDGRLVNAEGALAGAHVTMAQGVERLVARVGLSPAAALHMAVTAPALLMGLPALASPEGRDAGDLIVLDDRCRLTRVGL